MCPHTNTTASERHWAAIGDVLGLTLDQREGMILADFLQLGVSVRLGAVG